MSIISYLTWHKIKCDNCEEKQQSSSQNDVTKFRIELKKLGWRVKMESALCPKCAKLKKYRDKKYGKQGVLRSHVDFGFGGK